MALNMPAPQATGAELLPAQLEPAGHGAQEPDEPEHTVAFKMAGQYPGAQLQDKHTDAPGLLYVVRLHTWG